VGSTLLKSELFSAVLACKANLIKHVDQVSIELLPHKWILALSAIGISLQPLVDAAAIKDVLTVATLDCILSYTHADSANERIDEFAFTVDGIVPSQFVTACMGHQPIYYLRLHVCHEFLSVTRVIFIKPRVIIRKVKSLVHDSSHWCLFSLQKVVIVRLLLRHGRGDTVLLPDCPAFGNPRNVVL